MGYTHYFRRKKVLPRSGFKTVVDDFLKIIDLLGGIIPMAGPNGSGAAIIDYDRIEFNGVEKCGHKERDLGITWPADGASGVGVAYEENEDLDGHWFAGAKLATRTCGGDCSHESFVLERVYEVPDYQRDEHPAGGFYFDFCKTAYKPYDLYVICALIIAQHHLGKRILVSSDGDIPQWQDGIDLVQANLGYGADFKFRDDDEVPEKPPRWTRNTKGDERIGEWWYLVGGHTIWGTVHRQYYKRPFKWLASYLHACNGRTYKDFKYLKDAKAWIAAERTAEEKRYSEDSGTEVICQT